MAQDFLELLRRLADARCEFIIVGGVAAVLHGGRRVTFDLDIVPRLDQRSWPALIDVLWDAGGRPRIPETREAVERVENVERWMADKGVLALSFRSASGAVRVGLLVEQSHRFDELASRAKRVTLGAHQFLVVGIDDLIAMKRRAGRPQDLLDVRELEDIQRRLDGS